ncbi:hypothetical protein [Nocardia sp. alder85J]|uniref:hypothetical protein n=1 Tax=Nocardia sp. alder85J TaxID=2862949 RepID=UPI001CD23F9D|nr:hypothetical protein [Nocardia sp. alder85J]MCX4094531.1 hypothetical protein [Nocardia sp. alder85J]
MALTIIGIVATTVIILLILVFLRVSRRRAPLTKMYASEIAYLATVGRDAEVTETGGGCTALYVEVGDARIMLATNRWDGSLVRANDPRAELSSVGWMVGVYEAGAFVAAGFDSNLRAAVAAAFESLRTGRAIGSDPQTRQTLEAAFERPASGPNRP